MAAPVPAFVTVPLSVPVAVVAPTVMFTTDFVDTLLESTATTAMRCAPAAIARLVLIDDTPSCSNFFTPSSQTCMLLTALARCAAALTVTGEGTVAPFAGLQMFTDGTVALGWQPALAALSPKFSVVVAPEFTVADCELAVNPLADAVTVYVPAATLLNE